MSYKTVEVELENGRVSPSGTESLPAKARALLTILNSTLPEQEEVEGPSIAELAADLAGVGAGEYSDLSTNKAHLDDLGG